MSLFQNRKAVLIDVGEDVVDSVTGLGKAIDQICL